jgi:hypothetical protein
MIVDEAERIPCPPDFIAAAALVHLPGRRLRAAGSNPLWGRHLRLPALLSARLCQLARGRWWTRYKAS